ncbi:MAG: ABC transporter permease [Planctomycetales bacterium]
MTTHPSSLTTETPAATTGPWLPVWTLCQRELVRFFRQRNRVVGAVGQPVLFWILFGAGFGSSFQLPGATNDVSYFQYYFPGTLVLIILFTAIFATISIIEDRREGFLQAVLVAPVPRWAVVLGKVLGGGLIALAQGLLFLLLGLTIGIPFSPLMLLAVTGYLFIIAIGLNALGFIIAWRLDSTQGFHAIMSVFLIPMWLLSGAFFPAGDNWLGWVIRLNPLTYAVAGLRRLLYWGAESSASVSDLPSATICGIVTFSFALLCLAVAWWTARLTTKGDLLS